MQAKIQNGIGTIFDLQTNREGAIRQGEAGKATSGRRILCRLHLNRWNTEHFPVVSGPATDFHLVFDCFCIRG